MATLFLLFKLFLKLIIYPFYKCLLAALTPFIKTKKRSDYSCNIVLITGAAQGIGKALASEFADHGATLVLWDICETKLLETCSQLTSQGHEAFAYVVDCSKREEVYQAAEKVKEEVGNVSVLVNNAGTMAGKSILEFDDEDIERTIGINLLAHFWTVRAFLPWMIENNYGHIVEICSLACFNGIPKASDYCSSKAGVLNFAHSLRMELMMQKKMGVAVTCVLPAAVDTELSKLIHTLPHKMDPSECARQLVASIANKPFLVSVGGGYFFAAIQRYVVPASINDELFMMFVGNKSMDDIIGKKKKA